MRIDVDSDDNEEDQSERGTVLWLVSGALSRPPSVVKNLNVIHT